MTTLGADQPSATTPRAGLPDGAATVPTDHADTTGHVDLAIGGMTCASCATRVERKLNRLPGVQASVNLATERARVTLPADLTAQDAIRTVEATGYTAQLIEPSATPGGTAGQAPTDRSLELRVVAAAVLTVPVLLLSMVAGLQFPGWEWVALALTAPVVTWAAWPLHRAGWLAMLHGSASMDSLISIGVIASSVWSLGALLLDLGHLYLEVAATVTTLVLLGRLLEHRARRRSGNALRALLELGAKDVEVVGPGGVAARVPVEELRVGQTFLVRPGERVATDGRVTDGASALDTSLVTGEPVPVDVGPGDAVVGGTVNTTGLLTVRATQVGSETHLARIATLVAEAQTGKAPVQRLADRVSAVFVPVVIGLALVTLVGWLLFGPSAADAFAAAVAVLIIACPCALGLATPTALLAGTGRGAQLGLLIRGPQVLESTRRVDTVVFDKTGTLTTGRMRVAETWTPDGVAGLRMLAAAAAVEHGSEHPIARAVTEHAVGLLAADGAAVPAAQGFSAVPGHGARAVVTLDGVEHEVVVGRPGWVADLAGRRPDGFDGTVAGWTAQGGTVVAVGIPAAEGADVPGEVWGLVHVTDTVKPGSAAAVQRIHEAGMRVVLLTGDAQGAADDVARRLGIEEAIGGVLPEGKLDEVARLQDEGRVVALVGDGVNDAAALARADVGIAMGSGADVALEAGDLTLMRSEPGAVLDAIALSRRTLRTIQGNLAWAFGYNVAAIPLAMAGLLNPMVAAGAMAFSSLFVVSNSLRLVRWRP